MNIAKQHIKGWGGTHKMVATVYTPATVAEVLACVTQNKNILARGNGRSYGDSSLNKTVVDMRGLNKILAEENGWIEVQAGITLAQMISYLLPQKKLINVVPGTQQITVGGAIASDVHGKNHHQVGSFYNMVQWLQLVTPQGELITCSRSQNSTAFNECFGAMGLSGIVVAARLSIINIETSWLQENQFFATSAAQLFHTMQQHKNAPYIVAWIDMLNPSFLAILKTGSWVLEKDLPKNKAPIVQSKKSFIPVFFRFRVAPPAFLFRCYNWLYQHKAQKKSKHILHFSAFLFPLDKIKNWNKIFGKKGFVQYHFCLPSHNSEAGIATAIELVKNTKATCTLAVLKIFGPANPQTANAFAMEGYHLALDFINNRHAAGVCKLLDLLVSQHQGRVYKTKDAISTLPSPISSSTFSSLQNQRYARAKP